MALAHPESQVERQVPAVAAEMPGAVQGEVAAESGSRVAVAERHQPDGVVAGTEVEADTLEQLVPLLAQTPPPLGRMIVFAEQCLQPALAIEFGIDVVGLGLVLGQRLRFFGGQWNKRGKASAEHKEAADQRTGNAGSHFAHRRLLNG